MYQKNVSDIEIKQYMASRLSDLSNNVKPRIPLEPAETPKNKPEAKKGGSPDKSPQGNELSDQVKELMENIYQEPLLSVTKRSARIGLSAYKMNQLKKEIMDKGFARQFSVNLGKKHGGTVTMMQLSDAGYKIIGKRPEKVPENVSDEHWFWQKAINRNYESMKSEAVIEKSLNGKRADVGIVWNGCEVAIEVELTPKNALSNIVRDLEAGFHKVCSCCKNPALMRRVREQLRAYKGYEEIKDRVELNLLSEMELLK